MKYAYVGGPKPDQKIYDIVRGASQRQKDLKASIEAEKGRLEATKVRTGTVTRAKELEWEAIDEAKKEFAKAN